MKINKTIYAVFCISLALGSFIKPNYAEAGFVRIVNNSCSEIKTNIIPEPHRDCKPYCWKCLDGKQNPCGKQTAEIIVPLDAFMGAEYFAIVDIENGFLGGGKCQGLSVFKNYEVKISDTSLGTRCESREI